MKKMFRDLIVALALLALSTLNPQLYTAFAQGSLTPPAGPITPTMVTLSQIEPRTPISAPYTITKPGSYYLTTNITVTVSDAIDIDASGVTLDLNGFTISSTSPFESGTAIYISFVSSGGNYIGFTDITISNGHITGGVTNKAGVFEGPGFGSGISYFQAPPVPPYNVRVTGVTVSGCANSGINLGTGNSTVVESCTVNTVGGSGIIASSVSHSTAYQCGNTAISADNASDCYGASTGGDGLAVNYAVNNCYGNCNGSDYGIIASEANNCYGHCSGSGDGLSANSANNCYGQTLSSSGLGVYAIQANNCSGNCNGSGYGLEAIYGANNCYGSSVSGTGLNVSGGVATGCYGSSSGPGDGLDATAANNCYGYCLGAGDGLNVSQTASGCYGYSGGNGNGVQASAANTCSGYANGSGSGISASTAFNCTGSGVSGYGLYVTNNAENCSGTSTSLSGLYAGRNANNCYGISYNSGPGLFAQLTANNCVGAGVAAGLTAQIAIGCYGNVSSMIGIGVSANIANSCYSVGGDANITHPYNMP